MTAALLLVSFALALVSAAMVLWWGLATRAQQRAAAEHAETRLALSSTQRSGDTEVTGQGRPQRWSALLRRAGLPESPRTVALIVLPGLLAAIGAGLRMGSASFGLFVLALYAVCAALWFYRRIEKIQQRLVAQLPDFLEHMVRLSGVGNSLALSFQSAAQAVEPPLRPILDNALNATRAGMDLDRALANAAQAYKVQPLEMLAVILGTSIRIGGRSDQILQRIAEFMRDMEEVQRELKATTAETRTSAWVLGLLPVLAALMMALMSPEFFRPMFHDPTGQKILIAAVVLELLGAGALYKLAKSL